MSDAMTFCVFIVWLAGAAALYGVVGFCPSLAVDAEHSPGPLACCLIWPFFLFMFVIFAPLLMLFFVTFEIGRRLRRKLERKER